MTPTPGITFISGGSSRGSRGPAGQDGRPGPRGQDGTPGVDGRDGRDGRGLVPRGEWSLEIEYRAGDVVTHNGSSYIAATDSLGVEPTRKDNKAWIVLAVKGKKGQNGGNGPRGRDGNSIVGPVGPPGVVWKSDFDIALTYDENDLVKAEDGIVYISLQDNNVGHDPLSDDVDAPVWWEIFVEGGTGSGGGGDGFTHQQIQSRISLAI